MMKMVSRIFFICVEKCKPYGRKRKNINKVSNTNTNRKDTHRK